MKRTKRRIRRAPAKPSPAPVCTLRVDDLSRGGAGVAKDNTGRVIFIPFTAPGDLVKVKILSQKSKYAQGELLEILESSSQRQKPPCPVFGRCGGCDWQHLPYSTQWQTKFRGVEEALKQFKVTGPFLLQQETLNQFPATQTWSYRNRIQLHGFKGAIGFYAKSSHDIITVESCAIARRELNEQIEAVRQQGKSRPNPYKVELEVLPDGQVLCHWDSVAAASGFQQINSEQNQNLKRWVLESITPNHPVLDLYGGSANLSAQLAPYSPRIDCVDLTVPQKPVDGLPDNIFFHQSDVFPWVVKKARQQKAPSSPQCVAIIDPPRGGMPEQLAEFIQSLHQINVCELVAVGCKTDTWARDLAGFVQHGWVVEKIAVCDFFPQTAHVETAALLRRTMGKNR
jgi:23S rRNA (uracil1939-C5)-methyltransferase